MPIDLDEQGRPAWLFRRTAHEVCNRAGFADHNDYADQLGDAALPRQVRLQGPGRQVQRARARLDERDRRLPNVGGICMACTMPGFPDKYLPLFDTGHQGQGDRRGVALRVRPGCSSGCATRAMKRRYEIEPDWRRPGASWRAATSRAGSSPRNPDYRPVAPRGAAVRIKVIAAYVPGHPRPGSSRSLTRSTALRRSTSPAFSGPSTSGCSTLTATARSRATGC